MNARELSLRHMQEATAQRPSDMDIAQAQFITNLTRQAAKERRDAQLVKAWEARQVKVKADIERERKAIAGALAIGVVLGAIVAVIVAVAVIHFLATFGLPLLAVAVLVAILGGGSGCGCTVIVTHICGH